MPDLTLDHVGVAVRELDVGRAAYERLGFRLTTRSMHSGSPSAGAPVIPWGSGNHCAMFQSGYLEILGLTDPDRYSSVKDMVARYEGLHIVALGCMNADATYAAMSAKGIPVEAPRALERDAAYGPDGAQTRRARFRNLYVDRARFPDARFLYIEHLTRDVLWQPHLLDHPNGALALEAVYFCAAELAASSERISRATGAVPKMRSPGHAELELARGRLRILDLAAWRARGNDAPRADLPVPAGFGIRVRALDATRELLARNGVSTRVEPNGVWVAPEQGCGAALHFFQGEPTK